MKKNIYLNLCDFVVKVDFGETENTLIQKEWMGLVEKYWGGLEIKRNAKRVDYVIEMVDFNQGFHLFIERKEGDFYHIMKRLEKNRVRLAYAAGILQFSNVIKDLLLRLTKGNGFLMHASSCLDKKGNLYIFTAESGGGKSTSAKMLESKGWDHFCDDTLVVRKFVEKFVFYRPPFMEKQYSVAGGSYEGESVKVMLVKKGNSRVRAEKIDNKIEILRTMMGSMMSLDGGLGKREIKLLGDFIDKHSFYNLYRNLSETKLVKALK